MTTNPNKNLNKHVLTCSAVLSHLFILPRNEHTRDIAVWQGIKEDCEWIPCLLSNNSVEYCVEKYFTSQWYSSSSHGVDSRNSDT